MSYLDLNGRRVYYEIQGEGPDVILLHNATGSTRDWRYLMPRLAAAGYRALAYDRPGFGRSSPLSHWPLDYLRRDRDDFVALMEALDIRSAALVGNSDGATLSLLTAATAPQRIVLVVAESPHMWYERESLARGFRYFHETLEQDPRFIKAMRRAHGAGAHEVIRRWKERWLDPAFFDWDESAALDDVRCPVLVIHGERDPFFPASHSQQIARSLRNAILWLWPDVGHAPHLERPDEYAHPVIRFIDDIRREYENIFNPDRTRGDPLQRMSW
jgi:pimeloyl-ACP methyl ester carboxylesterase